jgi:lipoate-protein ligase B
MREALTWEYLGLCDYDRALALQESHWRRCRAGGVEVCLALEHPPVVTFGLRTPAAERVRAAAAFAHRGVACVDADRGGYTTFHAPGQLVVYPILDVRARSLGVGRFVALLEDVMIGVAAAFGVTAGRDARGRGVWTARGKLGSIGIRVRDGVSTHGLALNVALDLAPFATIVPCGMPGLTMTSLAIEGASAATVPAAAAIAARVFRRAFDATAPAAGLAEVPV